MTNFYRILGYARAHVWCVCVCLSVCNIVVMSHPLRNICHPLNDNHSANTHTTEITSNNINIIFALIRSTTQICTLHTILLVVLFAFGRKYSHTKLKFFSLFAIIIDNMCWDLCTNGSDLYKLYNIRSLILDRNAFFYSLNETQVCIAHKSHNFQTIHKHTKCKTHYILYQSNANK